MNAEQEKRLRRTLEWLEDASADAHHVTGQVGWKVRHGIEEACTAIEVELERADSPTPTPTPAPGRGGSGMTRAKLVERIARAVWERGRVVGLAAWEQQPDHYREHPRAIAAAVLADLDAAGLCIVLREPTEGMIRALNSYAQCEGYIEEGYRAMLAAAGDAP